MKLRIEKSIYGGAGLAHNDGKAIFVPFTLPGESIEARISRDHGSYADAELEQILEPSPHRAGPPCPYFGECGGCHYQHADYPQQIEIKSQILRETLERARLNDIPKISTLHSEPFGYRNRIRLHIDPATSRLSYKMRASQRNLPVEACAIAAPVLEQALKSVQSAAQVWELGQHFAEAEFFTNPAQDAILVSLWIREKHRIAPQELDEIWRRVRGNVPKAAGMTVFSSRKTNQNKPLAQFGEPFLTYAATSHDYRVSIGSFFQVNRFLIDPLVEHVTGALSGRLAWDLYAGVGLFSVALARRFERVTAVESAPIAVRDLRQNLRGERHQVVAGSALEFLRRALSGQRELPDFVLVDPPRAGLGKEVASMLTAIRPPHITYVSCDPATLSRDLKSLLDSGYRLSTLYMVDLFPQTFHLESVATLSLK